jgi:hypothetical protein
LEMGEEGGKVGRRKGRGRGGVSVHDYPGKSTCWLTFECHCKTVAGDGNKVLGGRSLPLQK